MISLLPPIVATVHRPPPAGLGAEVGRPRQALRGPKETKAQRPFKGDYLRLVRGPQRAVGQFRVPAGAKGDYLNLPLASRLLPAGLRPTQHLKLL